MTKERFSNGLIIKIRKMINSESKILKSQNTNCFDPIKLMRSVCNAPLRPCEKTVLLTMIDYLGNPKKRPDDWRRVWPSQKSIKEKSGVKSEAQISRIVKKLQELHYLTIRRKASKNGFRRPNENLINIEFLYQLAISDNANKANGNMQNKQVAIAPSVFEVTEHKEHTNKVTEKEILEEEIANELTSLDPIPSSLDIKKKGKKLEENITAVKDNFAPETLEIIPASILNSKSPENKEEIAIYLVKKYWKEKPSRKVIVGFWWALIKKFHPEQAKHFKKLTKHQYSSLVGLFDAWGDHAFCVLAIVIAKWEDSKYACTVEGAWKSEVPKLGPTPTILSKYSTGYIHYWNHNFFKYQHGEDADEKSQTLIKLYKQGLH